MDIRKGCQAAWDFWRPKRRELQKFLLKDGKKHPVAVICPGGGYSMVCGFQEGMPHARELNKRGYSAFVLYYRCRKHARFPAPMDDLAWAVREITNHAEEWNLNMQGYSVWGSSAGGHLAASFGTESIGYASYGLPKPGAIILSYPVVTMTQVSHGGSRNQLLGKNPSKKMIDRTSVEKLVTRAYPPTFVWYGEADSVVDPHNSQKLAQVLHQEGIPCELVSYPGVEHGVGLGEGLSCEGWLQKAVDFWEKHRS